MRRISAALLSVLFVSGAAAPPEIPEGADARAEAFFSDYYSAYADNDYERMAAHYDPDVVFEDPTSDSFIRGVKGLREAMGLLDPFRKLHWRFQQIVREGDIYAAQATLTGEANGTPFATRFATMVTVKNAKVVRHIDFLDNRPLVAAMGGKASDILWDGRALDDVAGKADGRAKKGEARRIAGAYLGALDRIAPAEAETLYAEDAVFEDPTFRLFMRGRESIAAYAKNTFPRYQYVRFIPETFIASADGAVVEGTAFGVAGGFQAPMRFMTFLRVAGGKITSHADFFDYGEYERLTRLSDLTRDTKSVTAACEGKAARQFAFWPGSWAATIASGTEIGRNRIERAAGGCAIVENWDGILVADMKNHFARGLHWFDESSQAWRHIWVDDNGGVLEFKGKTNGRAVVYRPVREPDQKKQTRMTIRPLDDGRVEQYGEESSDRGRTWNETFRIFYARAQ